MRIEDITTKAGTRRARSSGSPISVEHFVDDIQDEWDHYISRSERGTFCHLIGWKKVIEKTFGYESCYLYARRGDKICGVLPLFMVRNQLFGKYLISTPFAVYGGICADDDEVATLLLERAKRITQAHGLDYLELRNIDLHHDGLVQKDLYCTFYQTLRSEEHNWKVLPRETRRLIRKAKKANLTVEIDETGLGKFYKIYSRNVKELGTPVFPISFFRNFMQEFKDQCNLVKVSLNQEVIAAVLVFYFKDHIMPYYGGALRQYNNNKYAPNNFMYWELMRYGIDKGYKVFDFGRSKKGTGAYNFKRHFGMTPTSLNYQYYLCGQRELPNLNPLNPKFKLFIDTWKKLPLPIANFVGPRLIKLFP